jgi:hypothetical protein
MYIFLRKFFCPGWPNNCVFLCVYFSAEIILLKKFEVQRKDILNAVLQRKCFQCRLKRRAPTPTPFGAVIGAACGSEAAINQVRTIATEVIDSPHATLLDLSSERNRYRALELGIDSMNCIRTFIYLKSENRVILKNLI